MPQSPMRRPAAVSRPSQPSRRPPGPRAGGRSGTGRPGNRPAASAGRRPGGEKAEHEILFQQYFKSACPEKTYAAQLKRAGNRNHYVVLTEGKRDPETGDVRKTRLFVYSEDFGEFFRLLKATAEAIRAHPVPDEVKRKRSQFWAKRAAEPVVAPKAVPSPAATVADAPGTPQAVQAS